MTRTRSLGQGSLGYDPPIRVIDPQARTTAPARQILSGVCVATAGHDEQLYGVTVSSLAVLSHRPALISMVLGTGSRAAAVFERSEAFSVSVLADGQGWLARRFADTRRAPGPAGLPPGSWHPGRHGPLFIGAICWLECRLEHVVPIGAHQLLVGRIEEGVAHPGRPLVNFAGELHAVSFESTTRGSNRDH